MRTSAACRVLLLVTCLSGLCRGGVKVQSPNGGESIPAGSRHLITWSCNAGVQQVSIEFSFTGGVFWDVVVPSVAFTKGQGNYLWTVPSVSSPRCLIRITALGKPGGFDQSDAPFTIFPCALRMDYDGDCLITFADFAAFAREWLHCGDPYDAMCAGNRPPRIVSSPPALGKLGQTYLYTVQAVDPDGDSLTYELLRGPADMVLDADSGRVSWTPILDLQGRVEVIVQVHDEAGAADVQAFELGGPQTQAQQVFTGAPVDGYPSLLERQVVVYTNAVRMAPQQYRDTGNQPPASVQVVIDGIPRNMALDLGTPAAGTYRLDTAKAANCRQYYFQAVTVAGESVRYPGPGVFLTQGEGACTEDYRP